LPESSYEDIRDNQRLGSEKSLNMRREEDAHMAEKCRGYAGKIKNRSTQNIKAPFGGGSGSTKGTVKITGNDLRSGGRPGKSDK